MVPFSKTAQRTLFVDFEASSLDAGSFPIEVGWCGLNGKGRSYLIRPAQTWTAWSIASQSIHGITREELQADGTPVKEVARRVAAAFAPERALVMSDAALLDQYWLNQLLAQGSTSSPITLLDMEEELDVTMTNILRNAGVPTGAVCDLMLEIRIVVGRADEPRDPAQHRALSDARHNAATWRDVVRQAKKIATRWRR